LQVGKSGQKIATSWAECWEYDVHKRLGGISATAELLVTLVCVFLRSSSTENNDQVGKHGGSPGLEPQLVMSRKRSTAAQVRVPQGSLMTSFKFL